MKKIAIALVLALVFASSGFAANTLTVSAAAALNGTNFGLSVNHSGGASNNVYVDSLHPTDETHYLIRFWIDPNNLVVNPNQSIRIAGIGDDVAGQHVVLFLRWDTATSPNQWLVNAWRKDDTGTFVFANSLFHSFVNAADKKRQYEFEWTAATGVGANNGSFRMTRLNPTVVNKTNTNLDNDTLQVDNIRIGTLNGQGVNATGGSYYFDEFESYR